MVSHSFLRVPLVAALMLLSGVFPVTDAFASQPQKTDEVKEYLAFRTLNVFDWPLATPMPWLGALEKRQDSSTNTVCGYLGGDPNFPATCSAGSHCAMDATASAVGCCPNGVACTTGVYTGCVDEGSPTQTVVDPYVFTCQGTDVCYRNTYDGNAYQYGCGTTSDGTSVAATASGLITTVSITQISGLITKAVTTPASSSTSISSSESSSSSSSSSSSTSSASPTVSSAAPSATQSKPAGGRPPPPPPQSVQDARLRRNGAIIGATIAGAALFVGIISMTLWMRKRQRSRNQRMGPGQGKGPSYISPMTNQKDFVPVPGQDIFDQAGYGHPSMMPGAHGNTTSIVGGSAANRGFVPGGAVGGAIASGAARAGEEEVPLTQQNEMTEFSRGFNDAIAHVDGRNAHPSANYGGGDITEERPLWQENRRQSRNLMWM